MARSAEHQGSVRIISGEWRSRRLPVAEVAGLRPSGDRLRETLFNWLTPWLPGARCVDLFAGTGALGFEAASRGAGLVTLVERDGVAAAGLRDTVQLLGASNVQVFEGSAASWIVGATDKIDIAFVDPPYRSSDVLEGAIEAVNAQSLLASNAKVFIEAPAKNGQPKVPDSWQLARHKEFARVAAWLFDV